MEPPPLPPPLPPRAPAAPPAKFTLGAFGSLALLLCVALVVWANRANLNWSADGVSRSLGVVVGTLLAYLIFCVGPAWLMWRVTRRTVAQNIILVLLLVLVTGANLAMPRLEKLRQERAALQDFETEATAYQEAMQRGETTVSPDKMLDKLNSIAGSDTPTAVAAGIIAQLGQEGTRNVAAYVAAVERFDAVPEAAPDDAAHYDPNIATARAVAAAAAKQADFIAGLEAQLDVLVRAANSAKVADDPLIRGFRLGMRREVAPGIKVFRGRETQYRHLADAYEVLKLNHGKWRRDEEGNVRLDDAQMQALYDTLLRGADEGLANVELGQEELLQSKREAAQP